VATNSIAYRAASALPIVGIALALANWWVKPQGALGWAAAIAMLVVMIVAVQGARIALRRSTGDAGALRSFAWITTGVVFGALMMLFPLGATLAFSFGFVDDPNLGQRATMILSGAFLAMIGNAMPRMLPPLAQMACDGVRVQHFQRLSGWIWALCGLTIAVSWLTLPVDAASPVSMTVTASCLVVTLALIWRRLRPRQRSPLPD